MDEVITPDAALNGPRGKRPSSEVNQKMAYVHPRLSNALYQLIPILNSELNLFAMALGPGKHLKGLKLMNGLVAPEEVCVVAVCRTTFGDLTQKHLV